MADMSKVKVKIVRESTLTKTILLTLGASALVSSALIFPSLGYVLKEFQKDTNKNQKYIKRAFKKLETQNLIAISEKENQLEITLTEDGHKKVLAYNVDRISVPKPQKWDRHWRVIIFDIPEKKKASREALRRNLQNMGFLPLQKSVFVHPYPCKKEVDFLKHNFDIAQNITYLVAKEIENEDILCRKFGL